MSQGFEKLLGRDKEVGDALFNLGELLLGLRQGQEVSHERVEAAVGVVA